MHDLGLQLPIDIHFRIFPRRPGDTVAVESTIVSSAFIDVLMKPNTPISFNARFRPPITH